MNQFNVDEKSEPKMSPIDELSRQQTKKVKKSDPYKKQPQTKTPLSMVPSNKSLISYEAIMFAPRINTSKRRQDNEQTKKINSLQNANM